MTKTKDQQAQEYVENVINSFGNNGVPCGIKDIKQMIANGYVSGYTDGEQSMWRSVEDGLPEVGKELLLFIIDEYNMRYGFYIGWRSACKDWFHTTQGRDVCADSVKYWMYIPSLPETNTEKK